MSPLTKVFVLLLVILSLILTAGMVVYVNRQESFVQIKKAQDAKISELTAKAAAANGQLDMAENARTNAEALLQNQRNLSEQTIAQLRSAVAERDANVAQINSNLLQSTAAQKTAADALTVALKQLDTQNGELADLRKQNLDLAKRNSEDSLAINDLTNKFDTVRAQWRDASEQNTQLQNDMKNMRETMHKSGISENNPRILNPESLVRVEGKVRSKQTIGNVPMATIDVGSADQVTKGMQLKLIDPNSSDPFLGYLVVDRVEPNEAIGHLMGPRINEVHPGVQVRSQL